MRGILFYSKQDYYKNKSFANWMVFEFKKKRVKLVVEFVEDFYENRRLSFTPDFIINRSRDYNLSLLFECNDVKVFNKSNITLLGNNKYACYKFIHDLDISIASLPLIPGEDSVIEKPNSGHGGDGISLNVHDCFNKDFVYQEFISDVVGDVRFYVIGNKIEHTIIRYKQKEGILCNYSKGAYLGVFVPSLEKIKIVKRIIDAIGDVGFIGVDFFITKDNKFIFNEIEDVVGSRMLSELKCNNTVPLYTKYILKSIAG